MGQGKGQPIASLAPGKGDLAALICEKLWLLLIFDPREASLIRDPGTGGRALGSPDESPPAGRELFWPRFWKKHDVISV